MRGLISVLVVSMLGGVAMAAKPVVGAGAPVMHFRPSVMEQTDGRLRVQVWAPAGAARGRATVRVQGQGHQLVEREVALRVRTVDGVQVGVGRVKLPEGVQHQGRAVVTHRWLRPDGTAMLNYQEPTERNPLGITIGATRTTNIWRDR